MTDLTDSISSPRETLTRGPGGGFAGTSCVVAGTQLAVSPGVLVIPLTTGLTGSLNLLQVNRTGVTC